MAQSLKKTLSPIALGVALLACGPLAAQQAGEVEFARGVGFAQTPGGAPRTLGKGLPLREGDRLTTSEGASAIIKLDDGTRMTVRPNSELVLQQYKFRENAPDNGMLMQLVRGGFRAVTGVIAKSSPSAARIQTSTATIGIRGTDFDARLCAKDCNAEAQRVAQAPRPTAVQASAKVVSAQGTVEAVDASGQRRRLVEGGSIYPGDVVETQSATQAVLSFRDDSRITLGASTRFRVDNFVYDEANAREGRFLASVLRGSVRALTGLIAKANNRNVGFATATATIGIRGTGLDISCTGPCASEGAAPGGPRVSQSDIDADLPPPQAQALDAPAGDWLASGSVAQDTNQPPATPPGPSESGLALFVWLGSIAVTPQGQTALQVLQAGQGLFITPQGIRPLDTPPPIDGPRPDGVTVPPSLFTSSPVAENQEGLFVFVRDGHIEVASANGVMHLGRGEASFTGPNGELLRPNTIPRFIDFDRLPLPTSRNPVLVGLLNEVGVRPNVCR